MRKTVVVVISALLLIVILTLALCYQGLRERGFQHLKVVDVGSICHTDTMLTYVTLQGVINRVAPRIYFIYDCEGGWTDLHWLLETIVPAGYTYENVSDPMELVDEFKSEISGIVVTDPDVEASMNIATMICSLTNAVASRPEMATQLTSVGLSVVEDLRGRWKSDVDAYEWAFENLYKNCSGRLLASLDPLDMQLRDYLVQQRVFTFWLNTTDAALPAEQKLLNDILSNKPQDIPILGWWNDEESGVREASEHGKYVLATDWAPNLSVHSRIKVNLPLRQPNVPQQENYSSNGIYVAFVVSDGDNVQYCMNQMRKPLWEDTSRGKIPLGWTISPSLLDLAPGIMKWYYESATPNDYFICGPSGIGYTYPDAQAGMNAFLSHSNAYCNLSNLDIVWTLGAGKLETLEEMASSLTCISSLFLDYHSYNQAPYLMGEKPIVPCCIWSDDVSTTIRDIRNVANSTVGRPLMIFVGATCWKMTPSKLEIVVDALKEDKSFEFVGPDQLVRLILKYLTP